MRHEIDPDIGSWYRDSEISEIFEVVAVDESDGYVGIQYYTGEIEEIDLDAWYELNLKRIPPPEDALGAYELNREEMGFYDETIFPEDWSGPLSGIEPEDYY